MGTLKEAYTTAREMIWSIEFGWQSLPVSEIVSDDSDERQIRGLCGRYKQAARAAASL
jgi:hypothetical protein